MQTCIYTWLTTQINTAKNSVHANINMVWPYADQDKTPLVGNTDNGDPSSNWPQTLSLSRNQPWILSLPTAPLWIPVQTSSSRNSHTQVHTGIPVSTSKQPYTFSLLRTGPRILLSPAASTRDTHANKPPKPLPDLSPSSSWLGPPGLSYCQIEDSLMSLVPVPHLELPHNLAPRPLLQLTG